MRTLGDRPGYGHHLRLSNRDMAALIAKHKQSEDRMPAYDRLRAWLLNLRTNLRLSVERVAHRLRV